MSRAPNESICSQQGSKVQANRFFARRVQVLGSPHPTLSYLNMDCSLVKTIAAATRNLLVGSLAVWMQCTCRWKPRRAQVACTDTYKSLCNAFISTPLWKKFSGTPVRTWMLYEQTMNHITPMSAMHPMQVNHLDRWSLVSQQLRERGLHMS